MGIITSYQQKSFKLNFQECIIYPTAPKNVINHFSTYFKIETLKFLFDKKKFPSDKKVVKLEPLSSGEGRYSDLSGTTTK